MHCLRRWPAAMLDWLVSPAGERVQALVLVVVALIASRWMRDTAAQLEEQCAVRDEVIARFTMLGHEALRLQILADRDGRTVTVGQLEKLLALLPQEPAWSTVFPDWRPAVRPTVAGALIGFEPREPAAAPPGAR
jgi:hypothetical protein